LRIFDTESNEHIGHLVDVTTEGVMLISEEPIAEDAMFHLRVMLPAEILGNEKLEFFAKVLWCRKDANPDFYNTGFQILEVSSGHFDIVEKLIDDYGFRD
jgi:hypothetical protein